MEEPYKNILNDIAIIFLPRPAILNAGVQLVCLPHIPTEYRCATKVDKVSNILIFSMLFRQELKVSNLVEDIVGKRPTVVGWGYTSGFDPYSYTKVQVFHE